MWRFSLPIEQRIDALSSYAVQAGGWVSRHKFVVISTTAVILLLAGFVVIATHRVTAEQRSNTSSADAAANAPDIKTKAGVVDTPAPYALDSSDATNTTDSSAPGRESFNSESSNVELNVNGQSLPVPQNGSFHKTITNVPNPNGSSSVDVSVNSVSDGTSSSSSSTSVNVHSNSSTSKSEISVQNSE